MSNKPKQYVVIVLDQSGSMGIVRGITISGFNEQIQGLKKVKNKDVFVSFYLFSDDVKQVFFNRPVAEVKEITDDDYNPNGMTAMLDGVQMSIEDMKLYLKEAMDIEDVLFVIMSDGQENHSKRATWESVAEQIQERQNHKWTFTYMGANQDLSKISERIRIPKGNMALYTNDARGTDKAFKTMGMATMNYIDSDSITANCFYSSVIDPSVANTSVCSHCGKPVNQGVVNFSNNHFGRVLCIDCQKEDITKNGGKVTKL